MPILVGREKPSKLVHHSLFFHIKFCFSSMHANVFIGMMALSISAQTNYSSIFDFNDLVDIDGNPSNTSQYKGNVILAINVASF
mmetsp:Transcript_1673/g.2181  ORF Transcript_1673/g.2181 Transcript_1673/m.2181 type:complete len:84 (-) Transcript_1673:554-805(-)